jgi:hypothetical protein
VDPERYLADLLALLADGSPQGSIYELMPWHWATTAGN